MSINGIPISRGAMTNEMQQFVVDIFKQLSEEYFHEHFPADKIPLALKAIGIDFPHESTLARSQQTETVDLKEFIKIVSEHLDTAGWCAAEMNEAFSIFDKDDNGYLDTVELKRVFTKMGENLTDSEMTDQLNEFVVVNDNRQELCEWYKMVISTKGTDYVFDD
jgi:Ca2+-binding EF-hand superfamily protein